MEAIFLLTVWTVIPASNGRPAQRVIADTMLKVGVEAMMQHLGSLPVGMQGEVRQVTLVEVMEEYSELVRAARTAGLVQGGCVSDHRGTYNIPTAAQAAAMSYKQVAGACNALMSGCKARGRRAELESIHDRARRVMGFMSDLAAN